MDLSLTMQYRQVHYERGVMYNQMGQYEQAVTNFNKALDLDPDCVVAYYERAIAYQNLKERQNAIDDYKQFLKLVPDAKKKSSILATIEKLEEEIRNPKPRRWIGLTKEEAARRKREQETQEN